VPPPPEGIAIATACTVSQRSESCSVRRYVIITSMIPAYWRLTHYRMWKRAVLAIRTHDLGMRLRLERVFYPLHHSTSRNSFKLFSLINAIELRKNRLLAPLTVQRLPRVVVVYNITSYWSLHSQRAGSCRGVNDLTNAPLWHTLEETHTHTHTHSLSLYLSLSFSD